MVEDLAVRATNAETLVEAEGYNEDFSCVAGAWKHQLPPITTTTPTVEGEITEESGQAADR